MKTKDLKPYGGVDGLITTITGIIGNEESLYDNKFWETVIWCLKDYQRLKKENQTKTNKPTNQNTNNTWDDPFKIGDRHEMGG